MCDKNKTAGKPYFKFEIRDAWYMPISSVEITHAEGAYYLTT